MIFDWDENKNQANFIKHELSFETASKVFESPSVIIEDNRFDYGEKRYIALGKVAEVILVVVFTRRKGAIRIISGRKANKRERRVYHEKIN